MRELPVFLFVFLCICSMANAQNVAEEKVTWKVLSWFDGQQGEMHSEEGVLITNDDSIIKWYDQMGDLMLELNIEGKKGSWHQPQFNGSFVWFVNDGIDNGTVTIERKGPFLVSRILISSEPTPAIYELTLSYSPEPKP